MNKNDEIELPALFIKADKQSERSQNFFINLYKVSLILLVIATFISSASFEDPFFNLYANIFLIISLLITVVLLFMSFEKGWYDGRAIAESVKSLSWKFMTGSAPFPISLDSKDAEERLINNFKKIIGQKKEFFHLIGGEFARFDQITNSMREVRKKGLVDRIKIYSKNRLEKQKDWYANNADKNKSWKYITYYFIILFQVLAVIGIIVNYHYTLDFVLAPFFVVISSVFIAWLQLKKYQELSQSYSITATELSMIKSKVHHIKSENDLAEFVDDAETAISREHTLWLARRDSIEIFD